MLDRVRGLSRPGSLWGAWALVALWLLGYAGLNVFAPPGIDLDSAEQVYFAQSWQMGYGLRQPPLYTWLLLALKPDGMSWMAMLDVVRYTFIVLWLAGVQSLARVSGASPAVQARTVLLHLGLVLVMWRVHDSLTHTVLAACLTIWGAVALVRALSQPAWWVLVGALGALACLSKFNAALWCASSLVAAGVVLLKPGGRLPAAGLRAHLGWLLAGLLVFVLLLAPYARWWLAHSASAHQARRIVLPDPDAPVWWPLIDVLLGVLEYMLLGPGLIAVIALVSGWAMTRARRPVPPVAAHAGLRWMAWQSGLALLLLTGIQTAMQGTHFTARWVWPVAPALTVWACVWGLQVIDAQQEGWARRMTARLCVGLPVLALLLIAVRLWEPHHNAEVCGNCWADRPGKAMSESLHARHGAGPLRIIAGDSHLAGILAIEAPRDRLWTAQPADLPPPEGFSRLPLPCVAAWVGVDGPGAAPVNLQSLIESATGTRTQAAVWPMALEPRRSFHLQSRLLPASACASALP